MTPLNRLLILAPVIVVFLSFQAQAQTDTRDLKSLLPRVKDKELQSVLSSPDLILYTDEDFPRAYQHDGAVHSAYYNISASKPLEKFGNGNIEFPWGDAAGTQDVTNLYKFRFLKLPPREDGVWPIVYWRQSYNRRSLHPTSSQVFTARTFRWIFPKGTVVGEVLCLYDDDGVAYPFELRTRQREIDRWEADVYRPFSSAEELQSVAKKMKLDSLVDSLDPEALQLKSIVDNHPRPSVSFRFATHSLPTIPKNSVISLLNRSFVSVNGKTWKDLKGDADCFAPTTDADFHIVPAGYNAAAFSVPDSCIQCHEDTNQHVDRFEGNLDTGRDWYGHIRGSDGIFSIHPFDQDCISSNGFNLPVSINQKLVDDGVFALNDLRYHPKSIYRQIKGLR